MHLNTTIMLSLLSELKACLALERAAYNPVQCRASCTVSLLSEIEYP